MAARAAEVPERLPQGRRDGQRGRQRRRCREGSRRGSGRDGRRRDRVREAEIRVLEVFFVGSNGGEEAVVIEGEEEFSLFTMMLMITVMICRVPTYWRITLELAKAVKAGG